MPLYRAFGTAHLVNAFIADRRLVRSALVLSRGLGIASHARNSWNNMELKCQSLLVLKSRQDAPHERREAEDANAHEDRKRDEPASHGEPAARASAFLCEQVQLKDSEG